MFTFHLDKKSFRSLSKYRINSVTVGRKYFKNLTRFMASDSSEPSLCYNYKGLTIYLLYVSYIYLDFVHKQLWMFSWSEQKIRKTATTNKHLKLVAIHCILWTFLLGPTKVLQLAMDKKLNLVQYYKQYVSPLFTFHSASFNLLTCCL